MSSVLLTYNLAFNEALHEAVPLRYLSVALRLVGSSLITEIYFEN